MTTDILISKLHPMVKAQATNVVKESIQKIGLQHPVVIMWTNKGAWEKEKKEKYNFILDPPDIKGGFYQIRFGHNRVEAYKELGYTSIPTILCDTTEKASKLGKEHSLWMKQKLGPL